MRLTITIRSTIKNTKGSFTQPKQKCVVTQRAKIKAVYNFVIITFTKDFKFKLIT